LDNFVENFPDPLFHVVGVVFPALKSKSSFVSNSQMSDKKDYKDYMD
jgi:hypothetical protein